ncbi:ankyrin, partial [Neocallimastix californiae]
MFCDVNEKDASGNTILYYAILNKHIGTVKYLINHGADVNCTDNIGNTLFDNAISTGNKEIIISLIQSKNLLLNKPNCNGETPLCSIINNNYLVIEDKEIIISELVKKGANVNFEDDKGNTPLIYAIQKNYLNISKYL